MGLAAYWVLVAGAGLALVGLVDLDWRPAERLAAAMVAGLVGSTLLSFGLSLWWGPGAATALVAPAAILAAAGGVRWRRGWGLLRSGPGGWWAWVGAQLALPQARSGLLVLALLGAGAWVLFSRALVQAGGGIDASYPTVWADWSVHASYVQSFHLGHNLPPQDSLEAGTGLRYPFLVDFQPALLLGLGQNLVGALDVPSWLIAAAAATLIWHLALRVSGRRLAAWLTLALVLFGGGLGFIGLYGDGCQQLAHTQAGFRAASCTSLSSATPGAVGAYLLHFPAELSHLPRSYDGQSQAHPPLSDLEWYEPLLVYWLPQRDFVYGMALVALLALMLWEAYRGRRRTLLLAAGVAGAALPWFNPFGYLVVALLGLWWLGGARRWRDLGLFLVPLLLLGLPRLLYVIGGPHGQLANPVGSNLYPELDLGWLANAARACTQGQLQAGAACNALYLPGASWTTTLGFAAQTLARPSWWAGTAGFWLANTGTFGLLALAGPLLRRVHGPWGRELAERQLLRFAAPFWALFLAANLLVSQPWNWDNTKLLEYWYLGAAIPVAWLLAVLATRGASRRLVAGVVVLTLVLGGSLSLALALEGGSSLAQGPPSSTALPWADAQAEQVAQAVRRHTPARAVFLTEGQPDDPVTTLAGRSVVLAYSGWLWSYGQPLRARFGDVERIYAGCPSAGPCAVGRLLRAYDVWYIEFEPGDYNDIPADLSWFEAQHLPVVVRTADYVIFAVRRLWRPRP
ncbi:MAG: hypothetical protein ACRENV_01085 [Candidatus Dormibacteria bacterium]